MIYAIENMPHHYEESCLQSICKSIPFKEYFYCRFGFEPKDVYYYFFNRNKSSLEEPSYSTSLSNEEEEWIKSEDSSNPSTCSSIMKFFGVYSRRFYASDDNSTLKYE